MLYNMMIFAPSRGKLGKTVLLLAAIFFLWTATFGLLYHTGQMNLDGTMSGCLFDGQTEACTMNFSEHVSLWQSILRSLPASFSLFSIFAAICFVAAILWHRTLFEFSEYAAFRRRLYIKQHPHVRLFDTLREIFSQGILNSKIYATVTM